MSQTPTVPPPLDEKALIQQAFQPPTVGDAEPEDQMIVAMLAGSTSRDLRVGMMDRPVGNAPIDPRTVVNEFQRSIGRAPAVPQQPQQRRISINPPQQAAQPVPVAPNTPQLELDLFRKMDMTDVYNILSEMQSDMKETKKILNQIVQFMEAVKEA